MADLGLVIVLAVVKISIALPSVSSKVGFSVSFAKVNRKSRSTRARQTLECFCSLHTRLATGSRRTLSRLRHRAPPPDLERTETQKV